jgi:hypothetical protein
MQLLFVLVLRCLSVFVCVICVVFICARLIIGLWTVKLVR